MGDIDESTARAALKGDPVAQLQVERHYDGRLKDYVLAWRPMDEAELLALVANTWRHAWAHAASCLEHQVKQLSAWVMARAEEWIAKVQSLDVGHRHSDSPKGGRAADVAGTYQAVSNKGQRRRKPERDHGRRNPASCELTGESALIARACADDRAAKQQLLQHYVGWVRSSVSWRGVPPADRDDVTQEVLLKALRALDKFAFHEDARGFQAWLAKIAMRCAADYFRARKARAASSSSEDEAEDGSEMESEIPPDALHAAALRQALAQMPKVQRSVFIAYYHDGLTQAEIASTTGFKPSKVFSLLDGARVVVAAHVPELQKSAARRKSSPPAD